MPGRIDPLGCAHRNRARYGPCHRKYCTQEDALRRQCQRDGRTLRVRSTRQGPGVAGKCCDQAAGGRGEARSKIRPTMFRTRFKKEIVAEFLPPARAPKKQRVILLCDGMPSMPRK